LKEEKLILLERMVKIKNRKGKTEAGIRNCKNCG
jgi:hypothetical protein